MRAIYADTDADPYALSVTTKRKSLPARALSWMIGGALAGLIIIGAFVIAQTAHFARQGVGPALAQQADAIIVLGSGLKPPGVPDAYSAGRTEAAVELWRAGVAPKLVFSGGRDVKTGVIAATAMGVLARELGVPQTAIFTEERSVSTFENARFSLEIARAQGWRKLIIVTDDFHLGRAWALFEYWDRNEEFEFVALAASDGWRDAAPARQAWSLLREILSYPFNFAKISGQYALEQMNEGADRRIR